MRKIVLFLLVNGIGFGHFKRALVIADAFDKSKYDVRFVVQASATDIFKGRNYPVYAFPLLYSIKHNNGRMMIYCLLDELIKRLQPCVVFEDTYPEDDYLNIPSLANVSRMLIVRRVESSYLEDLLFNGQLSCYDKVFFMEKKECIINQLNSPIVKTYIIYSKQCYFIGDIFDKADSKSIEKVHEKYNITSYKKTVVFNCGAGGWHIGENVCKKIFDAGLAAVRPIADNNRDYQFIFITGPYSEWSIPDVDKRDNIIIMQYEENLSALFQCADICVIRPGYNSVMECLAGKCDVILLPSISFMENQNDWCGQLVKQYGLNYVPIGNADRLYRTICECLDTPKRNSLCVRSNESLIVDELEKYLIEIGSINCECYISSDTSLSSNNIFGQICFQSKTLSYNNKIYPIINLDSNIDILSLMGKVVIVYNDENHKYTELSVISSKYNLFCYGIIPIEIYELKYITYSDALHKFLTMLSRGITAINIVLATSIDGKELDFVSKLNHMVSSNVVINVDLNILVQKYIKEKYGFNYNYSSNDIRGLE